ncbi:lysylphosphatidylglycerol synthase transmembrane domain-containing protein [Methanohalobium evestigatum]|uniref:lysylphosphatidylglycerol synthase transmembrane domain-containing protein n=1 Tax=Methanohalobium evestigatum TaxID=2322 RepID=UPI0018DE3919|nr:lysylphosphatidylglycerol synthase transmembrane domain-containing protein [Methanohalobium evestigatum]
MSLIDKLKKRILYSIIFAAVVVLGLLIYADFNSIISAFVDFGWIYLPIILILTVFNYIVRFYKWDFYLSTIGVDIGKKNSAIVFFSGLIMSITPGKLGEVLKSYLLKQTNDVSISRTAPVVFAERLTDIVGLIILSSVGVVIYQYGISVMVVTLLIISAVVSIIQSRKLSLKLIEFGEKLPFISKFAHHLHELYESAYILLKFRPLSITILLSIVSWFFECIAMWYVFKGFGLDLSMLVATFVFAFSSVAGAVSMLPGGLGVAEGSIVGLLLTMDVSKATATGSALIIRFCTLWFGVVVGIIVVLFYQNKLEKIN